MAKMTEKQVLENYPGLKSQNKPSRDRQIKKRRELLDFAHEHNLVMNPKGYDYYIESYLMFNCCPCDKSRLECPCPEALEEVASKGHCLCRLFWKSYKVFKEVMFKEVIK